MFYLFSVRGAVHYQNVVVRGSNPLNPSNVYLNHGNTSTLSSYFFSSQQTSHFSNLVFVLEENLQRENVFLINNGVSAFSGVTITGIPQLGRGQQLIRSTLFRCGVVLLVVAVVYCYCCLLLLLFVSCYC
jgi:hypothetical protein